MDDAKILAEILESLDDNPVGTPIKIEAAPLWFPKEQGGEAQAVVTIYGNKYAISLERLP